MAPVFQAPPSRTGDIYGSARPGDDRTYGTPRPPRPDQDFDPTAGGRRRADVTAIDLGYEGRRSRGSHSADDQPPAPGEYWRGRENTGGW